MANATQDANLKGITLPFYTVGSGDGRWLYWHLPRQISWRQPGLTLLDGWPGQKGFVNNTYDYTISDYPLSSSLYKTATANRQIVQFPIAIGGVSILYNLPGLD